MVYIRHRQRMVQESVFEDLKNTLIACRWIAGTTTRPVINPANDQLEVITTAPSAVFKLASKGPIQLIDFFPDQPESPDINTFAMDAGVAGDSNQVELGNSSIREQQYYFTMAFFAESDALASSVFQDLKDRYEGRIVHPDAIPLYDYLSNNPSSVAGYLDVETFQFNKDMQGIAPDTTQLYFGELQIIDLVD